MTLLVERETAAGPSRIRWSRSEYHQLGERGVLDGKQVELIDGTVIEKPPMGSPHWVSLQLTGDLLANRLGSDFLVTRQLPIALSDLSEPVPDVAVHRGSARDFLVGMPATADLVVEIADSSLAYDRREKASLYAMAGIPEYWIVNLSQRQLEVYRLPLPDDEMPFGFGYQARQIFRAGDSVSPLCKPAAAIPVEQLLP